MKTMILLLLVLLLPASGQQPLYKDPAAPVERRVKDLLSRMTTDEKLEMLSGTGFASKPFPRLGIPSLDMTDGPVGVRWDSAVAFPSAIMLAATFDTALAGRYGWALAQETKAKGRNTILGPCVNINRVPHGGRNFESFGEDPFLTSRMAVSYIKGVQQQGVVATVKHFAVNNQETERMTVNAVVDPRVLQEIYFPAFKAAVQEAKCEAVMCAYNKLNGPYCSENAMLLDTVLKQQWKFDGLVMSDWGAVHSVYGVANHGLDLEMPGGDFLVKEKLQHLLASDSLTMPVVEEKVRRMLRVMFRRGYFDRSLDRPMTNAPEHRAVALDVARAGIVLLKNENNILPLRPADGKSFAVIGPNAAVLRTGGGGSSMVTPAFTESPLDGVKRTFNGSRVSYAVGARMSGDVPPIPAAVLFLPGDTTGAHGVRAEYFDNKELRGEPKLRRVDANIDFRWGGDAPAAGFGKDGFSVRWRTILRPALTGQYDLSATSDDGIRVSLNGARIIDHWSDHAMESRSATVTLQAGASYDITVEFYENGGDAGAVLGWTKPNENELTAAVEAARASDAVLLFIGSSQHQESEGFDRESIALPAKQRELIDAVTAVNPNTVVVLNAGAAVDVAPWIGKVKGLLWVFFPGQEGTQAVMDVLTGAVNPSGKLPFTVAQRWEDYPAYGNFPGHNGTVEYKEGLLVGYRHFDTKRIEPLFPFGYGMSYTTFELSALRLQRQKNGDVLASVRVKNTGTVSGAEVVQLYVHDQHPAVLRPEQELKAFTRVHLVPGEEKHVTLLLPPSAFQYFNDRTGSWERSRNGYRVRVGTSSRGVSLTADMK